MAETSAGWTERDAKRGPDRAVVSRARDGAGARPSLSTLATLEGPEESRRVAILEFPNIDKAKEFFYSPEYQETRKLREGAAEAQLVAIEGV